MTPDFAQMQTLSLPDGRILHYHRTDRFKTAIFSVRFCFPVTEGRSAADSLLPRILQKGCRPYPSERELALYLEELYGTDLSFSVDRAGDRRMTSFTVDYLCDRYLPGGARLEKQVLSLLRSIILEPLADPEHGFSAELTALESAAQLDRLRSIKNHKERYAVYRCAELMRDKSRYDVPTLGTEQELLSLTPEILYQQYIHMLTSSEVHFYYVGPDSPEQLLSEIGDLGAASSPRYTSPYVPLRPPLRAARRVTEETDGSQSVLVLGYRTGTGREDSDLLLFPLFLEILSESPISKLFMSVREKKNLCYSVRASASLTSGTMMIYAGIDRARRAEAERAIRAELAKCRRGEISEQELLCAKEALENAYYAIGDSPSEIDLYYSRRALVEGRATVAERVRLIREASAEDIARIAGKLSPDTVYFLSAGEGGGDDAV